MNTRHHKTGTEISVRILQVLSIICLLSSLVIFLWFGWTRLSAVDNSAILPGQLEITGPTNRCKLNVPEGTLSIQHPLQSAMGAVSQLRAEVNFSEPLNFSECIGGIPNWKLQIEAQTELIGAKTESSSIIRQPLSGRTKIVSEWDFSYPYIMKPVTSHLWLRLLVLDGNKTIERWSLLVREFPLRSVGLFGLSASIVLPAGIILSILGLLLILLAIVKKKRGR